MRLRDYQTQVTVAVENTEDDMAVEQPTGSGKTVLIVALAARLLSRSCKVLIAAPQEHIENCFVQRDYSTLETATETIDVPPSLVLAARENGRCTDAVLHYLTGPPVAEALVCTHATLTRVKPPTGLPALTRQHVLVVDEAHHSSAEGLSQFVTAWRRAGGRVLFFTATAYRSDDKPVILAGMRVLRRTLSQHMEEGFAPARIETEIIGVVSDHANGGIDEFSGEELSAEETRRLIVESVVERWTKLGKPKTVIRVPSLRGGSNLLVDPLLSALSAEGGRVLDMTGTADSDKTRILGSLASERALDYHGSNFDVLLGVQRVSEGLDWPVCSDVFCIGMPSSIATVAQLLGRATRPKLNGYPVRFGSRSAVRFFVPLRPGGSLKDLPDHHARRALLLCSYLENMQQATEWKTVAAVAEALKARLGEKALSHAAAIYPYIDPVLRAEADVAIASARQALVQRGVVPTEAAILAEVSSTCPMVDRSVVRQVLVEHLVAATGVQADEARKVLSRMVARHLVSNADNREMMRKILAGLSKKLRAETTASEKISDNLVRHSMLLTGKNIRDFAGYLSKRRPLTVEWVRQVVQSYFSERGRFPLPSSGAIEGWEPETWMQLDQDMRKGRRKWRAKNGRNLYQFCHGVLGDRLLGALHRFRDSVPLDASHSAVLSYFITQRGSGGCWGGRGLHDVHKDDYTPSFVLDVVRSAGLGPVAEIYIMSLIETMHDWFARHVTDMPPLYGIRSDAKKDFTRLFCRRSIIVDVSQLVADEAVFNKEAKEAAKKFNSRRPDKFAIGAIMRCPASQTSGSGKYLTVLTPTQRHRLQQEEAATARISPALMPMILTQSGSSIDELADAVEDYVEDVFTPNVLRVHVEQVVRWRAWNGSWLRILPVAEWMSHLPNFVPHAKRKAVIAGFLRFMMKKFPEYKPPSRDNDGQEWV